MTARVSAVAAIVALHGVLLLSACGDPKPPSPPAPTPPPTPQSLCSALGGQVFVTSEGNATVTSAQLVGARNNEPEYCNVQGTMPPALRFEIKLPTNWNQRLLYVGGGGFDGAIPQPPGYQLQQNYATVASDGGHTANGNDENWALNVEQLNDFAHRSVHKTLNAARLIIQQRYNQSALRSYFEGCSNGGREALIQAQRYPNDFDGIVARAPAYNFTWLMTAGNATLQQFFASSATQLSAAKINTLSNAVLATCDALDNVADGIVSNPAACRLVFDPSTLRCTGGDSDTCLTDAQIATVNTLHDVYALNNGTPYYIGWPPGGESDPSGWPYWVAASDTGLASFSTRFIRYFLQLGAGYDPMNFVPDDHLPMLMNRSALIDASSTDYSAFRARGGKLVLWHGTNDWAISFNSTALYYNQMVQAAGGQASADQFVEFFPAPGVQHCFGGAGPDFVDLLTPLRNWVENGVAPSQQNLNTVKLDLSNLTITNARPLCKFPQYPRYSGSGNTNSAGSYVCVTP